jgi:hypothetical protein
MKKHLQLVESDFETVEKKKFPRFPFCYLTFKSDKYQEHVFEIRDISFSGMQLELKNGLIQFRDEEMIAGKIHWSGQELSIEGQIKWVRGQRIGVEFSNRETQKKQVTEFLKIEYLARHLKPVHQMNIGSEYPTNLKYWMRADGPVELFVWQHASHDNSHFEILIMENFIEWTDGKGLRTGRIMSKRDLDTPLLSEDEFVFRIDETLDEDKVDMARALISFLNPESMDQDIIEFMKLKLS